MWNMILLCIVQCAIGTRNRETTVHIHTHTMQMIRYPSYVLHWCTVLKCTKIGGGKCMRTHCGTVCSRSDKPTDKQTAGWYVSGWCVTVRGKPQASLVVTQMQAHHITITGTVVFGPTFHKLFLFATSRITQTHITHRHTQRSTYTYTPYPLVSFKL